MITDNFPPLPIEELSPGIDFHFEDITAPEQFQPDLVRIWITRVIEHHQATLGPLQYIFCSDAYLLRLNVDYLDHDTLTDIITFPYAAPPRVYGDLYISLERVADNATDRQLTFLQEMHRVIIHGVLHLIGYGDKTPAEAQRMRALEEEALQLLPA